MRLLLDTHIFLWAVMASPLLKARARKTMAATEQVFVSSASIWEVALRARLGKIEADGDELLAAIAASGFIELAVSGAHAACVTGLPLHHIDPFDRTLVAQSITKPWRLMTADQALAPYGEMALMVWACGADEPLRVLRTPGLTGQALTERSAHFTQVFN